MRMRHLILLALMSAAALIPAAPAGAVLGLSTGTPATFASLGPGSTSTATGTVVVTTTLGVGWTLTAHDASTSSPGRLDKLVSDAHCATGDDSLTNPVALHVTGGGTSAGSITLSGAAQTVASGSTLLVAAALTTAYQQVVPAGQRMAAGCPYQITTTFTLS